MASSLRHYRWAILALVFFAASSIAGLGWGIWKVWQLRQTIAMVEGEVSLPHQQADADRALLEVQLARIRAVGDPLTTAEMTAFHRVPEGTPDLTLRYLALLENFQSPGYEAEVEGLPIVGDWEAALVPLNQPDEQRDALRAFLGKHSVALDALEKLALEPGSVRYPIEFQNGREALLSHGTALHRAAQALRLRHLVQMQAGEFGNARSSLQARFRLSETLAREPFLVSQLICLVIAGDTIRDVSTYVTTVPQTQEELLQWQMLLLSLDFEQGLVDALIGERAMFWHTMHQELNIKGEFCHLDAGRSLATGNDLAGIFRMRDCASGLALFNDDLDVARQGFPINTRYLGHRERFIEQRRQEQLRTKRPDYMSTIHFTPDFDNASQPYVHQATMRNIVVTQIALTRYRVATAKLPRNLTELAPGYVKEPLVDPWDGEPLRYLRMESSIAIYSVGQNCIDDGGEGEFVSGQTQDVVLHVELTK